MFNVGGGEILVILLLALLVLGPDKLPGTARKVGRYVNEFRRMTSGFQEEFRQAMDLGGSDADSSAGSSLDDAVHRTTPGPRLQPAPELAPPPEHPAARPAAEGAEPVDGPTVVVPAERTTPPDQTSAPTPTRAAFAADVTPAPGTGPELITPSRPPVPPEDPTGSSSAA
jgi:sec-independent protein translocase protein TatB